MDRFWQKVNKTDKCWLWVGAKRHGGYGDAWWNGRHYAAHRLSYSWLVGPIEEGMTLDHICRVTACVNPTHLRQMTMHDNARIGNRYAFRTACSKGHPYTPENTKISKAYNSRECRSCKRAVDRAYHQRHKEKILRRKREAWRKAAGRE
jgi:hypothetical protein